MSNTTNKKEPFDADKAMDEIMELMKIENGTISEHLQMLTRYKKYLTHIYMQGFNEGYESKNIDL